MPFPCLCDSASSSSSHNDVMNHTAPWTRAQHDESQSRSGRRQRPLRLVVAVAASYGILSSSSLSTLPSVVTALSASPTSATRTRTGTRLTTDTTTNHWYRSRRPHSWTDPVLSEHDVSFRPVSSHSQIDNDDDDTDDDDTDDDWDKDPHELLSDFQRLTRATQSDVLHAELQQQIDDTTTTNNNSHAHEPSRFLDVLVQDASRMEKVAMSTMPQQLPRAAVTALQQHHQQPRHGKANHHHRRRRRRTSIQDLDFSQADRVSPEEEIELAKLIQKGVALHKLKTDLQDKMERDISRSEWTTAAGNMTVKQLRKTVSDYRRAKQLLVSANMGLVHAVVKGLRHKNHHTNMSYEEMVQEGSLGLLRAAELFDPSRGLRFSTYATIWIKGMLSNSHSAETITLPQREKTKWNKIRKAHDDFVKENDRQPSTHELLQVVDLTMGEFVLIQRKMTQAQQVLSLDYEYQTSSRSGAETSSMASLQNDKAFMADVDIAERTQLHADIVAALTRNLDAREARLMRLRYGLTDGQTRTISDCADAMGLSQSRTQQIAKQCLKKLRQAAEMESLQEYLLTVA